MSIAQIEEETKSHEATEEGAEGETEGGGDHGHGNGKKSKLIIIIVSVVVLLLVVLGGAFFMMKKHSSGNSQQAASSSEHGGEKEGGEGAKGPSKAFIDVEPFLVNLNTGGKGASFLKLKIKLEVDEPKDRQAIEDNMPKIRDVFQLYLRELRPSDMQGSVGLYRLREELLLRVNKITYPAQVTDILFDEVLVQ